MPYTSRIMNHPHPLYHHVRHAYPTSPPPPPRPSVHEIRAASWEQPYPSPPPRALAPLGHSNYQSQYHYRYQEIPYQYSSPQGSFQSPYEEQEHQPRYPSYEHHDRPPYPRHEVGVHKFSIPPPRTQITKAPPRTGGRPRASNDEDQPPHRHMIRDEDVVCGRGAPSLHHPGNLYFRQIVRQHQSRYLAARRIDKPAIACRVVELVQERGGEFIKRSRDGGWEPIGEHRAYEKACQALREGAPELRRKLAAREIAAAALCLDRLSSTESGNPAGSDDEDERDDRNSSGRDALSKTSSRI